MRTWPRRRPRRPATSTDVFRQKLRAVGQRGDELLRQAYPQLRQEQRDRIMASLLIADIGAAFAVAWLIGNWITAQFPPPPLFPR